jgi:hypothetical protein
MPRVTMTYAHAQIKIHLRASNVFESASTDRYPDNQYIRFSTTLYHLQFCDDKGTMFC